MSKSRKRAKVRYTTAETTASDRPADHAAQPTPLWFRPAATYLFGAFYIATAMALLVMSLREESRIGAVCGEACGGTSLFGVSLEWWGGALMAGVLVARWLVARTMAPFAHRLLVVLVLGHAGASLAFAGSQWLGIVPVCPLCQVAAFFSFAVALSCLSVVRAAFEAPLIPAMQSLALGFVAVMAIWPFLDGVHTEVEPLSVAQTPAMIAPQVMDQIPSIGALDEALDSLTIGDPDAPFEFVMITDFSCRICQRFEQQQLPKLLSEGVDSGNIRVRFVLTRPAAMMARPFFELTAATSLAMAGMPAEETLQLLRDHAIQSAPQGVALAPNAEMRERASQHLHRISSEADWQAVTSEHQQRTQRLRDLYFPGRGGTPVFIMVRGRLDFANPPDPQSPDVLALYGFQLADTFLEFAGLNP